MQYLPQTLASWTALLAAVATILGLIQSRGWLTGVGAILVCISMAAILYARSQRLRVDTASIEIEGVSIDSVNAANLRRRVNRSLTVQAAEHFATIDGPDLDMVWRYTGYCRAAREAVMEFSVDSANNVPFDQLDCFAFDLKRDPEKKHKIQPLLIGPDSISKKIAVPFLEPLTARQPFDIMLHCCLSGIYKPGIAYYTSTLSFDQDKVARCTVHLTFRGQKPDWVRVYDVDGLGRARLLKNLHPVRNDQETTEYRDVSENLAAQSARVYLFRQVGA
ncbi:MAG TPA: hypothetical protein VGG72_20065 [Bryobacteraceae bacterium]|jgi:hypothetical protein